MQAWTARDRARSELSRLAARGELVRVLPGVYLPAGAESTPEGLIAAAQAWDPDAILLGEAAAWLTFRRRTGGLRAVELAGRSSSERGWLRVRRLVVADELWHEQRGLRLTTPPATAAYLAGFDEGAGVDDALRAGVSLAHIERAARLMPRWPGARARRVVLHDSRDEPWSAAERRAHRLLRDARIPFRTNVEVWVGGSRRFLDILLEGQVVLEVDGYETHGTHVAFEADRQRHNELTAAGYSVLHLTWAMLQRPRQVLSWVAAAQRIRPAGEPRAA